MLFTKKLTGTFLNLAFPMTQLKPMVFQNGLENKYLK
jgi:hypothetical protein